MTVNFSFGAVLLTARVAMLATALLAHGAIGGERLGSDIWDVGRIPLNIAEDTGEYLGVYGAVIVRANGVVISRDQAHPEKSIEINIQRLEPADRQRLRRQCSRKACSEITMGIIVHGVLQATRSEPFHSSNPIAISSGLSAPGGRYGAVWRCANPMRCT